MKTYLDNPQLKEDFVKEVQWHREQDMIVQGTYGEGSGENWRGCAVGCSVHSLNKLNGTKLLTSDHEVYETALGIPEWLARLEDTIFEGLPKSEAVLWPEQFAQAVPVGVDLEPIKYKFCAFILKENIERVLALDITDELKKRVVDAIRGVLQLHEDAITTGVWDDSAARSAESAAESAARSARSAGSAWSAAGSAESAGSAAESATWSAAESAARSATWSAAGSTWSAGSAARSAAYTRYATELLRLIEETGRVGVTKEEVK